MQLQTPQRMVPQWTQAAPCYSANSTNVQETTVHSSASGMPPWARQLGRIQVLMQHAVCFWQVVEGINGPSRENGLFLKGHKCPENLTATNSLADVVSSNELLLMVVPTPFVERTLASVASAIKSDAILVSCAKGILNDTLETPHEILLRVLPCTFHSQLAYLSGPSFAAEVAKQLPTVVTIAAQVGSGSQQTHSSCRTFVTLKLVHYAAVCQLACTPALTKAAGSWCPDASQHLTVTPLPWQHCKCACCPAAATGGPHCSPCAVPAVHSSLPLLPHH